MSIQLIELKIHHSFPMLCFPSELNLYIMKAHTDALICEILKSVDKNRGKV